MKVTVIKVGGKIVEEKSSLEKLLKDFSEIKGRKILVHGGGRSATAVAAKIGIETTMIEGRRVTDKEMLNVVTMVYGGLVNKQIVAGLQAVGVNALGITGADLNIIKAKKRDPKPIDYGFVGDVEQVNGDMLKRLLESEITPIIAPLTHDGNGNMLNTNADTMAGETAKELAKYFEVELVYAFEKKGVLRDENDDDSVIESINEETFSQLKKDNIVVGGMIPKIDNALKAIKAGVKIVRITSADNLNSGTIIS